ncbi:MAG: NAD(P)/FAD-dependent oxidoreductase [Bacteroidia bacterium]
MQKEIRITPKEWEKFKLNPVSFCARMFNMNPEEIGIKVLRKSLDARKKNILYNLRLELVEAGQDVQNGLVLDFPNLGDSVAHVIGFGPAGIFASIELLRRGIKPIIVERGKEVKERRRDVAKLNRDGIMNPESNYCFGEGGAGTFSDGKLYTRSHKRGKIKDFLELLVYHGASAEILYEAHPHIGTNKLPAIIENLRKTIVNAGAELRFNAKLTDIDLEAGQIKSVKINNNWESCEHLILATGHSARDIYELLHAKEIELEAKPFAMGFRIEHPQSLIDQIQYHGSRNMDILPPSSYSLVEQVNGKGVFSFCMCPGGIIAPAATDLNEVVVNGWSPSKRNGEYANSGWVTEIGTDEWEGFKEHGALAGLRFQQHIEQKASEMAGTGFKVPAQNLNDYLAQKKSKVLNESSYHPGMTSVDLNHLYPTKINERLREGLRNSCKKLKGFDHKKAVIVAPESRTSAPVRIPRTKELHHPEVHNLYPCGEGAGYAGGILSAAMDGVRVAKAIEAEVNY